MALKTEVLDRIPTYPGRVKLTPVEGETNTYDLVRADQPIQEGTPINKALFDQKAYTLQEDVTIYVSTNGSDTGGDGTSAAPYATVQKAIDSLPKWLDGHTARIEIAAGTYEERVTARNIRGGTLVIGSSSATAVTLRGLLIDSCSSVQLNIPYITRSAALGGIPFQISNGSVVALNSDLTVDCGGANISGITVDTNSLLTVTFLWYTTVSNSASNAIAAYTGARVALFDLMGSNNTVGLSADTAAVISYSSNSITAKTAQKTGTGGRIYAGAQYNAPIY